MLKFICKYCNKELDISEVVIKSYKPNPDNWSHYNTKLNISCRTDDNYWPRVHASKYKVGETQVHFIDGIGLEKKLEEMLKDKNIDSIVWV